MKKRRTKQRNVKAMVPKPHRGRHGLASVKVLGVGGGGGNIVGRMMNGGDRLRGVEFIAVNTDAQDLDYVSAHRKLYIGKALTKGLGAGMNPEVGKQAAEENRSEIGEAIEGADILFLTIGLGGGTGSGGGPVVAEIARERGILTIGIVTKPFAFEGAQRMTIAQEGLMRLKDKVDALVVIPNDRIFSLVSKDTPIMRAFGYIDDVLKNAVVAVTELVNIPGIINVDFADIKAILKDSGATLIGIGEATGPERAVKAVDAAINSPLLEATIDGAKGVLFSIAGGRDLKMAEVHDIAKAVSTNLDPNARIIFGAYYDRNLKDKSLKVTVIATGFNGMFRDRLGSPSAPSLFMGADHSRREVPPYAPGKPGEKERVVSNREGEVEKPPKGVPVKSEAQEVWEIPAFLRKKKK